MCNENVMPSLCLGLRVRGPLSLRVRGPGGILGGRQVSGGAHWGLVAFCVLSHGSSPLLCSVTLQVLFSRLNWITLTKSTFRNCSLNFKLTWKMTALKLLPVLLQALCQPYWGKNNVDLITSDKQLPPSPKSMKNYQEDYLKCGVNPLLSTVNLALGTLCALRY